MFWFIPLVTILVDVAVTGAISWWTAGDAVQGAQYVRGMDFDLFIEWYWIHLMIMIIWLAACVWIAIPKAVRGKRRGRR